MVIKEPKELSTIDNLKKLALEASATRLCVVALHPELLVQVERTAVVAFPCCANIVNAEEIFRK